MASVELLTDPQCRYMRPEDVTRFNRVVEFFNKCRELLERQSQQKAMADIDAKLAAIAATMKIDRFRIGFVGPSQVGKSFTVANLLGVSKRDSPTPEGMGAAMTSAPTRIRRAPEVTKGAVPKITLHYMTRDEFRARIENIFENVEMKYLELTFDEDYASMLQKVEAAQPMPGHNNTHKYLCRFIRSGLKYHHRLAPAQQQRQSAEGDYNKRSHYVADVNGDSPHNEYLLLREAVIDFRSPHLPEDLEIIDLPGLGTIRKSDDEVTRSFLPELHGAFVFQSIKQLTDGAVGTLLNVLFGQYGDQMKGRIWYVVTRMDSLNESAVPTEGDTILNLIQDRIQEYRLRGEDDVLLVGNENYQEFLREGRVRRAPGGPEDQGWRFGANGDPEPLPQMRTPSKMAEMYSIVLRDGGIPLLQETATNRVRESIKIQTREKVERDLKNVMEELLRHLGSAIARSAMPTEAIRACARWEARISRIRNSLRQRDFGFIEAAAWQLHDELEHFVNELLEGRNIGRSHMEEQHRAITKMLKDQAVDSASREPKALVRKAFAGAIERLRKIDLPQIKDGPLKNPLEVCEKRLSERFNQADRWTAETFDAFCDPFPDIGSLNDTSIYAKVMRDKVAIVSRNFGMRLLAEIDRELKKVESSLKELAGNPDQINQADSDQLKRFYDEGKGL